MPTPVNHTSATGDQPPAPRAIPARIGRGRKLLAGTVLFFTAMGGGWPIGEAPPP